MNKLLASFVIISVLLSGCVSQVEKAPVVDTTEQSISEAGSIDSNLTDQETKDISSDLDQVINTLS